MSGFPYQALWRTWMPSVSGKVNYPVLVTGPYALDAMKTPLVPICYRSPFTGKLEDTYAPIADIVGAE